ncbi:LysE family transporter [Plantactinospora sp. KBS50]|uniref:LysE family transporter n=1 Tax=Plantactinospora sp. KBS50 TaxID=2024580 RepID=UPI000BAAE06C|nr:LysE family transporter [Plantactinospora sp. KBS50]ASW55913.1 lysine transporter LysE [Plantactinospora sp. KBS50]
MTAAFLAGLVAGYGVAVPVGAIAVLILGLSARFSLAVGAAAALGVATADGLYAATAVLGGVALTRVLSPVAGPLRWVAAGVLLVLAGHGAWRALARHRDPARSGRGEMLASPARAYPTLLGLTLLNPMTIVYFAALVIGRQPLGGSSAAAAALFVAGAFLASASWQLLIAAGGSLVGRVLAGPVGRLVTALLSSALIAGLAISVLV